MTSSDVRSSRLPDGFTVRIRPDLLRNTGELLVGGSPLRVLRLSATARECVVDDRVVVRDRVSAHVAARLIDGNLAIPEPFGVKVHAEDVTVVIPVRDRPVQLERCLAALAPLACVVVDDESSDRSAVASVAARHGASLVSLHRNVGPAGARNAGLATVTTAYVAFVDSDVEVTPDQLLGLATQFADREVALAGPLVKGVCRSPRQRRFERYDVSASSLDLGGVGARVQPGSAVAWLPGACLVGRTAVLNSIDGFDDRMRVGEDVDLVWRLVRNGAVVRYDPRWVAGHDARVTLRGWLGRKFVYGTGGAALAERHGDWTAPAILSPTAAVGAAALLLSSTRSLPVAAFAVLLSARALRGRLPDSGRSGALLAVEVAGRGLGWATRQESALLLRHWWPATATAALVSRRARRVALSALVVDAVTMPTRPGDVGFVTQLVCRRLDDLSYGAGLWAGAIRGRSVKCLLPRRGRVAKSRS